MIAWLGGRPTGRVSSSAAIAEAPWDCGPLPFREGGLRVSRVGSDRIRQCPFARVNRCRRALFGGPTRQHDISIASFDPSAGQLTGSPVRPIRQFAGLNMTATWSPDGEFIHLYLSKRDPLVPSPMTIVIHSLESGKTVHKLRPKLGLLGTLRWGGPAGRTFIARGAGSQRSIWHSANRRRNWRCLTRGAGSRLFRHPVLVCRW